MINSYYSINNKQLNALVLLQLSLAFDTADTTLLIS